MRGVVSRKTWLDHEEHVEEDAEHGCVCVCVSRNDGSEFSGSMFQKVSEKVEVGAQLSWSGANSMRFGIAAKFCAHPDATFRVSNVAVSAVLLTAAELNIACSNFAYLVLLTCLWPPCVIGQAIYIFILSFVLLFFLA